jgi:hypothetical protein
MAEIANHDNKGAAADEGDLQPEKKLNYSCPPTTSPSMNDGPVRPSLVITTVLMAIHDFEARSPDELAFRKGEKIEVLERDGRSSDPIWPDLGATAMIDGR